MKQLKLLQKRVAIRKRINNPKPVPVYENSSDTAESEQTRKLTEVFKAFHVFAESINSISSPDEDNYPISSFFHVATELFVDKQNNSYENKVKLLNNFLKKSKKQDFTVDSSIEIALCKLLDNVFEKKKRLCRYINGDKRKLECDRKNNSDVEKITTDFTVLKEKIQTTLRCKK